MVYVTDEMLASVFGTNVVGVAAYIAKATHFQKQGNFELAEKYFRQSLEEEPTHFWACMNLAKQCFQQGRQKEAESLLLRARENASTTMEKIYSMIDYAGLLVERGEFLEAEGLYSKAAQEKPDYPFVYSELARLYEAFMPPPTEKILAAYEQVLKYAPSESSWVEPRVARIKESVPGSGDQDRVKQAASFTHAQLRHLFRQNRYPELLEAALQSASQMPGPTNVRRIHACIASCSAEKCPSLGQFYNFVAELLASDTGGATVSEADLALAKHFSELALSEQDPLSPEDYVGILERYQRWNAFEQVDLLVAGALQNCGDSLPVLLAATSLMEAAGGLGMARLLAGRAVELAQASNVEVNWLNLSHIHDAANKTHAPKLGSIEAWLKGSAGARHVPKSNGLATIKITVLDAWLDEFFRLIGDRPFELLIDLEHYCCQGDVSFDNLENALVHYFTSGWREHRSIHSAFDSLYVRQQLRADGLKVDSEPILLQFLRHEVTHGLAPNPLFDVNLYRQGVELKEGDSAWFHYLTGGWRQNDVVSPYFDAQYFLQHGSHDPAAALWPPLLWYFCKDPNADANSLFHTRYYAERYKHLLQGRAPLAHYLVEGAYLGCSPNPFFLSHGLSARERIDYLAVPGIGVIGPLRSKVAVTTDENQAAIVQEIRITRPTILTGATA